MMNPQPDDTDGLDDYDRKLISDMDNDRPVYDTRDDDTQGDMQ